MSYLYQHKKLFKKRLQEVLDMRVGQNGKACCKLGYHAYQCGIERTTLLRYLNGTSSPTLKTLCILFDYIEKNIVPNFNIGYFFSENAKIKIDEITALQPTNKNHIQF